MADDTQPNGRMKLWLRLVLFASLALNLLVVGIVAGFFARGGPDRIGGPGGRDAAIPYARALSDEDRRALGGDLRRTFRDRRAARGEVMQDYLSAVDLLQADVFDRAALEALMSRQEERANLRQQAGRAALLDRLEAMTSAARRAYATRLQEQIEKFGRRRDRSD